jgi:beta-glucosidase
MATTQVGSDAHFELARQVAKESMVLLKNTKQRLPLSKNDFSGSSQLGLLGNSANDSILLMGNYHGDPSRPVVTPLSAFQSLLGETRVNYDQGVWVTGEGSWDFTQAIQVRLDISLAAFFNRFLQTCCFSSFCQRNSSQLLTPFLPCTLYILRPSIDD